MDKLLPVIEFLKKNGFWFICGIVAIASGVTWYLAAQQVDQRNKTLTQKLESSFQTGNNLLAVTAEPDIKTIKVHPNSTTEEGMQQQIERVSQSVLEAWKDRYEAQAKLMVWPDEIENKSQSFVDTFSKFNPPETFPAEVKADKLISLLKIYKLNIPARMDYICSIIKTKWEFDDEEEQPAADNKSGSQKGGGRGAPGGEMPGGRGAPGGELGGGGGGSRGGGGPGPPSGGGRDSKTKESVDNRIVCEWNEDNQALWYEKLTSFKDRDDHELADDIPTPSQIYMLQQDLWLLEATFNIIREVNSVKNKDGQMEMVNANDLAAIKRIDHVVFGREALAKLGDPQSISDEAAQPAPGAKVGGRTSGVVSRSGSDKGGEMDIDYAGQPAFHARYVDKNFDYIKAETVRTLLNPSTPLPNDNPEMIIAKRVPVRIALKIDERKIPDFLAACANSPFAFEVWQVRVNKHIPNEGISLHGGGGARKVKKKEKRQLNAAAGGVEDQKEVEANPEDGPVETRTNYDVKAEFYGIVKIYNPVDEARLTGKQPAGTGTGSNP